VAEHLRAAAVALKAKIIHDLLRVLALRSALRILFPELANGFTAAEAPDGDDHGCSRLVGLGKEGKSKN
jgi:hypothetical protein